MLISFKNERKLFYVNFMKILERVPGLLLAKILFHCHDNYTDMKFLIILLQVTTEGKFSGFSVLRTKTEVFK